MNDDTISRQAAIDSMCELMRHWFGCDSKDEIREIKRELGKLPSAQPERPKGKWVKKPHVYGVAYCSLCDYELHTNDTNFCPNCGADMRGDLIRRKDAIDALYDDAPPEPHYPSWYVEKIRAIPRACVDACDIFPDEEGADDKSE